MQKNVFLKVKGTRLEQGEPESVEFITEAIYRKQDEAYIAEYEESELTGMEGTRTVIRFQPDEILISRSGTNTSELYFERNKKHVTMYETEFGTMTIGVVAPRIEVSLDDTGGNVDFDYFIELNHVQTSENNFHMQIWEVTDR